MGPEPNLITYCATMSACELLVKHVIMSWGSQACV